MGNKHCHDSCKTSTLQAPLGSVVLLSCSFGSTSLGISPGHGWVVWNHGSGSGVSLVNITSSGKVDFLDPRQGRVKAFPNQGVLGNFSISIDALQASDLGSYCCELQSNDQCHRVEVEELDQDSTDLQVLFFSICGVAVLIVLLSGCFCWVKWTRSSAPPENVTCSDNVGRDVAQERGAGNERPIYELMSRLRQSSLGRHYYANQAEINQQARAQMDNHQRANEAETNQEGRSQMANRQRGSLWRKKPKEKCEFKNPIYNNSTDQLNNL
ncbi:unnamed protein product [Coregonus sp. 'balchen']|nr:unnamed protein product [Coregonus sp. 'balchen']